jgi:IMP dehydrogenase/GMP reductase
VIQSLKEGLVNGMIYSGAKRIEEMKQVSIGIITPFGQQETRTHDLFG